MLSLELLKPETHCAALRTRISPLQHHRIAIPVVKQPLQRTSIAPAAVATSKGYWTLAEPYTLVTEAKKSRFIATAWPVSSAAQASQLIDAASEASATHNCYAYKVGQAYRSSDDGEPSGTAGRPILGAIEGDGLDGVAVLVVRYFGGIKLGAGGLVRAYGGAARDCLRAAPKAFVRPRIALQVEARFEDLGPVYNALSRVGVVPSREEYHEDGTVVLEVDVQADQAEALQHALGNATSGRAACRPLTQAAPSVAAGG